MGLRQKPIQEYRPTEEPKAVPTANAGESAGLEDVLQVAEAENAIQEKLGLLRKEIQEMELTRTALNEATKAQDSAKGELGETMKCPCREHAPHRPSGRGQRGSGSGDKPQGNRTRE